MLFFLSSASFSFWSILSWDEDCSSVWLFLNSVNHSSYQSMIYDWREGFDKRTNSSLPPPGIFSTLVTTLPGTNCTCVGGAAGEVGGDTLLLGFFTAGESTISKALPARRWWNEYQGPWQGLYSKQVQSHRKGELPPRVSNSCLVAASTSAISSSLAWTRQNENCMSWSISSVPYQRNMPGSSNVWRKVTKLPEEGAPPQGLVDDHQPRPEERCQMWWAGWWMKG